ncbi:FtsX-like permease family protein [Anaerococcus hydrogenalis]|uniref:FtsX-like permease family protein n=1 Tax=Anaerococcus hydrogenalis TaxID=33029 RepID=UPI001E11F983|nr:FtsX-like permease family protein [Anaerococcus hydrogenalis]MBS5988337.1 FtsX-like permease family protein [Anaerococcus hydrogenalis]
MKKNNYYKSIFRDIKNTKGKILSIFIMIMLASMVVVALFMTGPSMRKTLGKTLNKNKHPDISIRASYGIKNEDRLIIEKDKDIDKISYRNNLDLYAKDKLVSVKSFDKDIEKLNIIEGKKISNDSEIILDKLFKGDYKLGDNISFKALEDDKINDLLKNKTYKIVGFANSSEYLMEDLRDMSIKGKEMVYGFAYINKNNFKKDQISQVDITYKKTRNMDRFSEKYKTYVKNKRKNLKEDFKNRPSQVLKKLKDDTNKKLDKKEDELNDNEKKLKDEKNKLIDANQKLLNGISAYNKAENEYKIKISQGENSLTTSKNKIDQGFKKLNEGKIAYKRNLDSFNKNIGENEKKLEDSKIKLDEGYKELNKNYDEIIANKFLIENSFSDKKTSLDSLAKKIDDENLSLSNDEKSLDDINLKIQNVSIKLETLSNASDNNLNKDQILKLKNELESLNEKKSNLYFKIEKSKRIISALNSEYNKGKEEFDLSYNKAMEPINENLGKLDKVKSDLDKKKSLYETSIKKLNDEKDQSSKKLSQAKKELDKNEEKLNNSLNSYQKGLRDFNYQKENGKNQLAKNFNDLLENQRKLDQANKKFDEESKNAQKEIDDGYKKIKDARENLVNLVDPTYEIDDIFSNKSIDTYYKNSLNMDELSKVFPTFFYFIALLVSLTTIKRYIEEQRVQNGTLKALGYSNFDIGRKFFIYALIPTISGSILGCVIGKYLICKVIFNAYSSGFDILSLDFINSFWIVLFTIFLSTLLISLTVYFTSISEVKEQTADLLRPKAPKKGSRIFLEKVKFIWTRLSFMTKITFRNLFRYKARMFMTIFGIGGCTALLFFGFAMTDSVKDTSKIQRGQITKYDYISLFDENAKESDKKAYQKILNDAKSLKILYKKVDVSTKKGNMKVNLIVFDDVSKVDKFINIRDEKKNKIDFNDKSVIISKNLSKNINLGKDLEFDLDNKTKKVKVKDISENYIDDYIYMSKDAYKNIFNKNVSFNGDIVKSDKKTKDKILSNKISQALIEPNKFYERMDSLMANLNLVIAIITLVSLILAVVVLYNLTNINVSERKKELATTKVLGFYPRETTAYIYRETYILTFLGIILGYILGYIMLRYVLNIVAPDGIFISNKTHLSSYVISAFITLFTSFLIMIIVHFKLKKINMAEAMKAGE